MALIKDKNLGKHCGVDEVGRGAWSGPVVAAAVRLNSFVNIEGLADSKTINFALRVKLYHQIIENSAVGVSFVSSSIVDSKNIFLLYIGSGKLFFPAAVWTGYIYNVKKQNGVGPPCGGRPFLALMD